MLIYIMRHGDAVGSAATDPERALSEHGKIEVKRMAEHLTSFSTLRMLVSPYLRAQQTADILANELKKKDVSLARETLDLLTPNSDPVRAIRFLEETESNGDTLLIAHQPLVGSMVALLTEGHGAFGVAMTTASIAKLEIEHVGLGTAQLLEFAHP